MLFKQADGIVQTAVELAAGSVLMPASAKVLGCKLIDGVVALRAERDFYLVSILTHHHAQIDIANLQWQVDQAFGVARVEVEPHEFLRAEGYQGKAVALVVLEKAHLVV